MNRKYCLKKSKEIEKLIKARRSVGDHYYTVYYAFYNDLLPQIAVTASKKIKTAAAKNYEKRVIREILRPSLFLLEGTKILVVAKKAVKEIDFSEKKERLLRLIKRINKEKK
ncbi:MAG: ribonuclease P protein component [Bacilli bacterium]|jgi:ribonuclease P protein component|nr:ribonuclease P protein component [Bacillota bacterium]NLM31802.1 ribonuclease P protein component [Acholeplasmataceae bacterium]HOA78084.1 ribonuclease P protein component [Bacilli bacterium]HPZ26590.1 ribonuclease P protein component [Bacilli bacterium]HQC89064.1 ribonuclease P protein component [Bacilli bacterium]